MGLRGRQASAAASAGICEVGSRLGAVAAESAVPPGQKKLVEAALEERMRLLNKLFEEQLKAQARRLRRTPALSAERRLSSCRAPFRSPLSSRPLRRSTKRCGARLTS